MRVDIVHLRDPDYECQIEVYVDGELVEKVELWDLDPGRGYEPEDVEEMRQFMIDAAPDFLKDRLNEAFDDMEPVYDKWGF